MDGFIGHPISSHGITSYLSQLDCGNGGAKPKAISEALGHTSVALTMDVYSHIIEGMQEDAMALLDEVLPSGRNVVLQKSNANSTPNK